MRERGQRAGRGVCPAAARHDRAAPEPKRRLGPRRQRGAGRCERLAEMLLGVRKLHCCHLIATDLGKDLRALRRFWSFEQCSAQPDHGCPRRAAVCGADRGRSERPDSLGVPGRNGQQEMRGDALGRGAVQRQCPRGSRMERLSLARREILVQGGAHDRVNEPKALGTSEDVGSNELVSSRARQILADTRHTSRKRQLAVVPQHGDGSGELGRRRSQHGEPMKDEAADGGRSDRLDLAGSVSHLDSMRDPLMDMEHNCAGQIRLLEACRSFNPRARIVFTSTRQVYGKPMYLPVDEQHPIAPLDVNGIHKRAAELYHLLYHRVYNIPVVCLRLTNTYGPRQLVQHDRQGFIGWFIRQAMDGGVIEVFGDGKQERELVYVDDVVDALLLAGASKGSEGEVFNLGGDDPISLAELAGQLIQLTGRGEVRIKSFPAERKLIDLGSFYASYEKIESAIGWRPKTSLREGLRQTIEFYAQNREHYWSPGPAVVPQSEIIPEMQSYQSASTR